MYCIYYTSYTANWTNTVKEKFFVASEPIAFSAVDDGSSSSEQRLFFHHINYSSPESKRTLSFGRLLSCLHSCRFIVHLKERDTNIRCRPMKRHYAHNASFAHLYHAFDSFDQQFAVITESKRAGSVHRPLQ